MFGFLGIILLFVFIIIIIVLSLLGNIIRMIFSFGKRTPKRFNETSNETNDYNNRQTPEPNSSGSGKKKIFGKDEGEYVEFEEVK